MYMSNQILITCKCDVMRLSYNFIIIKKFPDIFCWWCNQNTKMLSVNIYLVIRVVGGEEGGGTHVMLSTIVLLPKKTPHVYIDVHMHILKFLNNLKIEFYIYIDSWASFKLRNLILVYIRTPDSKNTRNHVM